VFSYSVNLNWIQGFVVPVARLVIWPGAGVWCVLEPWFLRVKGLPFWAQGKLRRQAWVSQWQAPGRKFVWVHGRLSSGSSMTLTTTTTRQEILLLLSEAMLPWFVACRSFRGGTEENSDFNWCLWQSACMHVYVRAKLQTHVHARVYDWIFACQYVCVCAIKTLI